jgi:putative ATP-grasp target RiPP
MSLVDATAFPINRQLPLGKPYGVDSVESEPPTSHRPFGLTLATKSTPSVTIDLTSLCYDSEQQIGLIRDGERMVPFSKHTDGQTSTITDGGDGQNTNKDSDTDHRED